MWTSQKNKAGHNHLSAPKAGVTAGIPTKLVQSNHRQNSQDRYPNGAVHHLSQSQYTLGAHPASGLILTSCATRSDLSMTTNSFLFLLSTLPNMYLPDFPQADRIYRSGNQLQLRCLLLPKACLGYTGICPGVYPHTEAAQTPWRIPTSPAAPQPCWHPRACRGPHFKINTTLLTLYPDLSPRAWALPRRQTERLSWAERWACGWGPGLGVDTAGTASPAIFLRDLGQVAGSSGPPLSPLQNVMQISWCTFPVGTDQEFKSKWHF